MSVFSHAYINALLNCLHISLFTYGCMYIHLFTYVLRLYAGMYMCFLMCICMHFCLCKYICIELLRHVSYAMVSSGREERCELLAHFYLFMVRHMYMTYNDCRYGITTFFGDPSRHTVARNQRGNCLSWLKEISDHLKHLPKNSNRQLPHNLALVGHGLQACIVIFVLSTI